MFVDLTQSQTRDAFGRCVETKQYLGDYTRNLYDGFRRIEFPDFD